MKLESSGVFQTKRQYPLYKSIRGCCTKLARFRHGYSLGVVVRKISGKLRIEDFEDSHRECETWNLHMFIHAGNVTLTFLCDKFDRLVRPLLLTNFAQIVTSVFTAYELSLPFAGR